MRNLTIWGAVAVLAVLVATVAVFGSTDSAQASTCTVPTVIVVSDEQNTGGGGLADNTYDVDWVAPGCGQEDLFTVVLEICEAVTLRACKTVKFETASTSLENVSISGMKGVSSKGTDDVLTAYVRVKHTPGGRNDDHDTGASDNPFFVTE